MGTVEADPLTNGMGILVAVTFIFAYFAWLIVYTTRGRGNLWQRALIGTIPLLVAFGIGALRIPATGPWWAYLLLLFPTVAAIYLLIALARRGEKSLQIPAIVASVVVFSLSPVLLVYTIASALTKR